MLAFPCNAFGGQEPGTWEEIQAFAKARNISFPVFPKVEVNGGQESPVFAFLKSSLPGAEGLLKVGSCCFCDFFDSQLAADHRIWAMMLPDGLLVAPVPEQSKAVKLWQRRAWSVWVGTAMGCFVHVAYSQCFILTLAAPQPSSALDFSLLHTLSN